MLICLENKPQSNMENVIMIFNHAAYVLQPSVIEKEKLHNR